MNTFSMPNFKVIEVLFLRSLESIFHASNLIAPTNVLKVTCLLVAASQRWRSKINPIRKDVITFFEPMSILKSNLVFLLLFTV